MRHRILDGWIGASVCSFLLLFLALGTFSAVAIVGAADALAQDAEDSPADVVPEAVDSAPDAVGEEDDTLDPEDIKQPEPETSTESPDDATVLEWMYQSLGIFYSVVFLGLSFTLVALFVMNLLAARRENMLPASLVEGFEAQLDEKQYQEAYELAKNEESFLGQVLSAGLAKLSAGYQPAIEAMQEVGEEENMKMEHRLSYMALIGTISPMIGLLGTVQGMIKSFRVIATSPTTPKPAQLAEGISTALFTTLVGLCIAIPAIAVYNILRNRVARLVLEVGILSEALMSRFANVGGKKN